MLFHPSYLARKPTFFFREDNFEHIKMLALGGNRLCKDFLGHQRTPFYGKI